MAYDFDVIVIGAGPAGLSAAIRVRWVKTAHAIPASVLLLDPAGIGGLARIGTICLTGPSFNFIGQDLIDLITADVTHLEIPLLREYATGIRREDACWVLETPQRTLRCLAVVLATGLRRMSNEAEALHCGRLTFLSGGYERAAKRFTGWSAAHRGQRLLLVGGEPVAASLPQFRAYDAGRNRIDVLCEPRQRVRHYRIDEAEVVVSVEEGGELRDVACDNIMLDFHSLEQAPPSLAFVPSAMRDAVGFSAIGPRGDPAYPGVYAAGDCVGFPSMTLKAMAQGAEAGFNAYRFAYDHKFRDHPPLFAFYVSETRPPLSASELPEIDPSIHQPVGLSMRSRFAAHPLAGVGEALLKCRYLTRQELDQLSAEVAEKIATVHRR